MLNQLPQLSPLCNEIVIMLMVLRASNRNQRDLTVGVGYTLIPIAVRIGPPRGSF